MVYEAVIRATFRVPFKTTRLKGTPMTGYLEIYNAMRSIQAENEVLDNFRDYAKDRKKSPLWYWVRDRVPKMLDMSYCDPQMDQIEVTYEEWVEESERVDESSPEQQKPDSKMELSDSAELT